MAKIIKHSRQLLDSALQAGVAKAETFLKSTIQDEMRNRLENEVNHRLALQKTLSKYAQFATEGETLADTAKRVQKENDDLLRYFMGDLMN